MRDLNEQMNENQNSRAKLKQRIAGGAVLIIVLAIFLPFIFHHARVTAPTAETTQTALQNTQTAPVALPADNAAAPNAAANAEQTQQTQQASSTAQPNQPAAAAPADNTANTAATAEAPSTAPQLQQSATAPAAPADSDQSLRSDQPGVTPPQNESAATPAPTQPVSALPPPQSQQQIAASTNEISAPTAQNNTVSAPVKTETQSHAIPSKTHKLAAATAMAPAKSVHAAKATARELPPPGKVSLAKAKVVPSGNWVVQVGSFSQTQSAHQLAAQLRAKGMHAYTQSGPNHLTRVYVGPLASQQQAEKIKQQVQTEFQLSSLVSKKQG